MRFSRKLAALAALSLLLVPNMAYAESRDDRCDGPVAQQDEDCKENRKAAFQTKFFQ